MNTKTFSTYLFPSYIMLGIIFLTACSPLGGAPVVLAQPDTLPEIPVTGFGADVAEALFSQRRFPCRGRRG